MRRLFTMLAAMLLAAAMVFFAGRHVATSWCARHLARATDDLAWLRLEFSLNDDQFNEIRRLHEGYLPVCQAFCQQIDGRKRDLQSALDASTNAPAAIESLLVEIGTVRARCQAAMLEHFRQVSQVMPPAQGRRYLLEMQRLTLGFHEQTERSMSPASDGSHEHH